MSATPYRRTRAPGIDRFGRSGLDNVAFHSGPIAKKAAPKAIVLKRTRNIHRGNHCPRCDSRLVAGKCPSCGYDPRHDGDFDDGDPDSGA